jgi:hypothetical protein
MQDVSLGLFKCSQPECSIETTGKCVNGLNVDECSNKINIVKDEIPEQEIVRDTIAPKTIRLQWGESFQEEEISTITYRYPCKLILLIGEPSSGKSTLYAALFDSFHKGGCGNYFFSSTRTPIGFERICYLAREKSQGKIPKTERTKSYEFTYYHLAVRDKELKNEIQHLIFADVNGERYQDAKNNDNEILKLSVLKRADQIFFIADGGLLVNNGEKHVVKDDVSKIITRCIQNNMLTNQQGINIIITKWDEITAAGKANDVNEFFIIPTQKKFNSIIHNIVKVASRSMNDEVPPRTGIDEFLKICLSNRKEPFKINHTMELKREFQKFKYELRP